MAIAWVFPGQGSQQVGMGLELWETELGEQRLGEAEAILGWSVATQCQAPLEELSQTQFTQPCLYVLETVLADLAQAKGLKPDYLAGHSLGEYVALYAAGVFDFATGLKLVRQRAELMSQTANGTMVALIGFDREQLDSVIEAADQVVLANDNHPGQVVISGDAEAVQALLSQIKVKRAVPLPVSGAFHSPLMANAAQAFADVLATIPFQPAQVPVLANVEPQATTDADVIKARLMAQMTGSVRWRETCLNLAELGVTEVIEIGPGHVLTGLVKRCTPNLGLVNIMGLDDLAAL
ncbi:ACP S-malonyltransferase [Synechococcus sp. PCC 6312]|uniref:ACP S-malonyltransferase n=1 Tax=Synechococcus sp. (strain ATCC 27167 / PCC 6312) TaxID=195253 RepID=UPI00029F26A8|nr:ACP S-malonyltransferase [Synechococcus sp. PCC 6312]AFY59855.1 malonyl CoA-acyl carrier protein transacylase [Synechococcus sp. PCC 6312]